MENITGRNLGPYQVVAPLGEGGMASVYKGYQPGVDRYVALKVLPRMLAEDPQFIGRFQQEARILAKLQHPHVLPVFDFGETDGYTYIVMPYLPEGTLADLLDGTPISLSQTATIISQLASALDYAHDKGLIHRDIKPSNVLFDENGNSLLADFGIAKMFSSTSQFTGTGGIIGTPDYMSPEQGQGKELDRRSDIYSLGIILYQLVTGRVPFTAETPIATVFKHINDPLPAPREFNSSLPEPIEKVLLKALAKDPADRFSTAGDLAAALQAAIGVGGASPTYIETPVQETVKTEDKSDRNRLLVFLLIPLLLLLCGGSYFIYSRVLNPPEQPPTDALPATEGSGLENDIAVLPPATETPVPTDTVTATEEPSPPPATTLTPTSPPLPTVPQATTVDVVVVGTAPRTETGLRVLPGQRLTVEYLSGSWQAGPSPAWPQVDADGDAQVLNKATFPVPDRPVMTLVGGIGSSAPAAFGKRLEIISNADGMLWLGPNDDGVGDNIGQLVVRVTVSDAESLIAPTADALASTPEPEVPARSFLTNSADDADIVYIPGGEFIMGLTAVQEDQLLGICTDCEEGIFSASRPAHTVELKKYSINRTETTNEMYSHCVNAGYCSPPVKSGSNTRDSYWANPAYEQYPVVHVDWYAARDYCAWAGGRLPTEAEWEYAARGNDGRLFPWGNTPPSPNFANVGDPNGDTIAVGTLPQGSSPFGVLDMAGNVWEWTADWYEPDYYARSEVQNPLGPDSSTSGRRVGRGGNWYWGGAYASAAYHDWWEPEKSGPETGFRCVLDLD